MSLHMRIFLIMFACMVMVVFALLRASDGLSYQDRTNIIDVAMGGDDAQLRALLTPRKEVIDRINNEDGIPLLVLALEFDNYSTVNLLLDLGANPNVANQAGSTPLHYAAHPTTPIAIASALLQCGANVNAINCIRNTPLHLAVMNKNKDVINLLIAHGANVNIKNRDGLTPLELAKKENVQW